jgi:hypothetical protein
MYKSFSVIAFCTVLAVVPLRAAAQVAGSPADIVPIPRSGAGPVEIHHLPLSLLSRVHQRDDGEMARHGTEVYLVETTHISYLEDGKPMAIFLSGPIKTRKAADALYVTLSNGRTATFPVTATVASNPAGTLQFVGPGEARPTYLKGRRADYVIP